MFCHFCCFNWINCVFVLHCTAVWQTTCWESNLQALSSIVTRKIQQVLKWMGMGRAFPRKIELEKTSVTNWVDYLVRAGGKGSLGGKLKKLWPIWCELRSSHSNWVDFGRWRFFLVFLNFIFITYPCIYNDALGARIYQNAWMIAGQSYSYRQLSISIFISTLR